MDGWIDGYIDGWVDRWMTLWCNLLLMKKSLCHSVLYGGSIDQSVQQSVTATPMNQILSEKLLKLRCGQMCPLALVGLGASSVTCLTFLKLFPFSAQSCAQPVSGIQSLEGGPACFLLLSWPIILPCHLPTRLVPVLLCEPLVSEEDFVQHLLYSIVLFVQLSVGGCKKKKSLFWRVCSYATRSLFLQQNNCWVQSNRTDTTVILLTGGALVGCLPSVPISALPFLL